MFCCPATDCIKSYDSARSLKLHRQSCSKSKQLTKASAEALRGATEANAAKRLRLETPGDQHLEIMQDELPIGTLEAPVPVPFVPLPSSSRQPESGTDKGEGPLSRSGRRRRIPKAWRDFQPSSLSGAGLTTDLTRMVQMPQKDVPSAPHVPASPDPIPLPPDIPLEDPIHITEANEFGLFRCYTVKPRRDPEESVSPSQLCDSSRISVPPNNPDVHPLRGLGRRVVQGVRNGIENWFAPCPNPSSFRLLRWLYSGSAVKSAGELDRLVQDVLLAPDFNKDDLEDFSTNREQARLDDYSEVSGAFAAEDGWRKGSVKIRLPKERVKHKTEDDAPQFEVEGLWYRRLIEVIKAAYTDTTQTSFHTIPFKLFHSESAANSVPSPFPPDAERIYSELYTCDAMLEEDAKIRASPRNPDDGDDVEYILAPLMLWSDATHLASFGVASLWPIYLFFGGVSKYMRCKPNSFAAHHLAYLPSLPDILQDFYRGVYGCSPSSHTLRFCKVQLLHEIWLLLLDPEFMEAYEHGFLVMCGDMIMRRIFPRFFTYSADYPERVLLACIRFLAECPCPLCLTKKSQGCMMGTTHDASRRSHKREDTHASRSMVNRARQLIFEQGLSMNSKAVSRMLGSTSLLPVQSAFSIRLAPFNFNFYSMFMPDLLHEFELGVWKAMFTHILRVQCALGGNRTQELDSRFRKVPTFGRSTIRRFDTNVSAMKKLAARDFEDILQCIIPCIEGLLDDSLEGPVLDLLWELASWHALAKLRLHTETTVTILEGFTRTVGAATRRFAKLCEDINTQELKHEAAARGRREAAAAASAQAGSGSKTSVKPSAERGSRRKRLNLSTFKYHGMGHFAFGIRRAGTIDNYSTQTCELEHKHVKKFYPRAKTKDHRGSIARHQRREHLLRKVSEREMARKVRIVTAEAGESGFPADVHTSVSTVAGQKRKRGRPRTRGPSVYLRKEAKDPLPATPYSTHCHISDSRQFHDDIHAWLSRNKLDPAFKDFLPRLQDHLLGRILRPTDDGEEHEYTIEERLGLQIRNDKLYRHKTMRINYTTYDMRRDQDTVNPRTHADVMVLAHEDDAGHPYWYARVLGIFHADVRYTGPGASPNDHEFRPVTFTWIRWFGRDVSAQGGFGARRLHLVGFVESSDPDAFGFLDPRLIIRGIHLIPAFHHGRTREALGPSTIRHTSENDEDWRFYYVNSFVDRDMFMRFLGGGIGHKGLRGIVRLSDTIQLIAKRAMLCTSNTQNDDAFLVPEMQNDAEINDQSAEEGESVAGGKGGDECGDPDGDEDEDGLDEQATEEAVDYGYFAGSGSSDDDSDDDPVVTESLCASDEDNSELDSDEDG